MIKDGLFDKWAAELHRAYDGVLREHVPEDMAELLRGLE